MKSKMQPNRLTWLAFLLGGVALSIVLFSILAPSMKDGDIATPELIWQIWFLLSPQEPVTEPTFTAVSDFIFTDERKRFVLSAAAIVVSIACLVATRASRRSGQHSLGYSAGVLASATALSLVHPFAFSIFVLGAFAVLMSGARDPRSAPGNVNVRT